MCELMDRIIARDVLYTPVPVKLFVHSNGLHLFGDKISTNHARAYAHACVERLCERQEFKMNMYGVGIVWGDIQTNQRVLDLVTYSRFDTRGDGWKNGNPSSTTYVVRNQLVTLSRELSCEDGMIVFGKEAQLRRNSFSIEMYLADIPFEFKQVTRL